MNRKINLLYPMLLCGALGTIFAISANSNKKVEADGEQISYIGENGKKATTDDYTVFDSSMTSLESGTYLFNQDYGELAGLEINGNVKIILGEGSNAVFQATTDSQNPGIKVEDSNSLEIFSVDGTSGSITGKGDCFGAGIGSGRNKDCGTIKINGGTVKGYGGTIEAMVGNIGGAGIGSGVDGNCKNVIINNGNIYAQGGDGGAGIGSGYSGSCEDLLINNGTIEARAGQSAAGIGGGSDGTCSNLTIKKGRITAYGGCDCPGIGSGVGADLTNINIYGGTIYSEGYFNVGLGAGTNGECTGIYIHHCTSLIALDSWDFYPCIGNTGDSSTEIYIANDLDMRFTSSGDYSSIEHSMDIDLAVELRTHPYIELKAQGYKVTYDLDGGTGSAPVNDQKYIENDVVTLPNVGDDVKKEGYTFNGWIDSEGNEYEAGGDFSMLDEPVTLYANWKAIDYSITYNLDGGVNNSNNPSSYTIESEDITLNDPTKEGFNFIGWYSEATFENKVTKINKGSTGDVSLFAKFEQIEQPTPSKDNNGGSAAGIIIGFSIGLLVLLYVGGFFCYRYQVAGFLSKPIFKVMYGWTDKVLVKKNKSNE